MRAWIGFGDEFGAGLGRPTAEESAAADPSGGDPHPAIARTTDQGRPSGASTSTGTAPPGKITPVALRDDVARAGTRRRASISPPTTPAPIPAGRKVGIAR